MPVAEMGLPIRLETRTGDTPVYKRQRQKLDPPDILLTTPEQVALLLASRDARRFFGRPALRRSSTSCIRWSSPSAAICCRSASRGCARSRRACRTIGLSATVAEPDELCAWLVAQKPATPRRLADRIVVEGGATPDISILESEERVPWQGHTARYAMPEIYEAIKAHKTTLLFVNTRRQAELLFQELWRINDDALPIALHHGSLDRGAAAARSRRRWRTGKPARRRRHLDARPRHRLGRRRPRHPCRRAEGREPAGAAHRPRQPPHGRAVEGHPRAGQPLRGAGMPRRARRQLSRRTGHAAAPAGRARRARPARPRHGRWRSRSTPTRSTTEVDLGRALSRPRPGRLSSASSISSRPAATRCAPTSATPRSGKDARTGSGRITNPRIAQQYRLNVGTIVEAPVLNVRYVGRPRAGVVRGGPVLGKIEEYFLEYADARATRSSSPAACCASRASARTRPMSARADGEDAEDPVLCRRQVPALDLPRRARCAACSPTRSAGRRCRPGLRLAAAAGRRTRVLPRRDELLVETFPRGDRFYMVAYPFEGRLAHQTLGMLLTRRLERARRAAARLRRHRLFARRLGAGRSRRSCSRRASRRSASSSTRTCSATTSRPGWPSPTC